MKGYDPDNIRIDPCGAIILWTHYGLRTSEYGWEIDHVFLSIWEVMTIS